MFSLSYTDALEWPIIPENRSFFTKFRNRPTPRKPKERRGYVRSSELQHRLEELDQARAEYEPLDIAYQQKSKELAAAEADLKKLARPLGTAAFEGLVAGQVRSQPIFNDRFAVRTRIGELQTEHDRRASPNDAGVVQKTKAKAQQLVVAGKIKLEQMKVGKLEEQIGGQLIASNQEESVRCGSTADSLAELVKRRSVIAQRRQEYEKAREALNQEKRKLAQALDMASVEGGKSLAAERRNCEKQIAEIDEQQSVLERQLPERLSACGPLDGSLGELIRDLRDVQAQLDAAPATWNPNWFAKAVGTWRRLDTRKRAIAAVCVVVAGSLCLWGMSLVNSSRMRARHIYSRMHMQDIHVAVLDYWERNRFVWPESLEEVADRLAPNVLLNPVTGDNPGYEYVKPEGQSNPKKVMLYQLRGGKRDTTLEVCYENSYIGTLNEQGAVQSGKSDVSDADCTLLFFAEYPESVKSSKYVGKRITVTGSCSSYGDGGTVGNHAVLDEVHQDVSAFCYFQAKDWKPDTFKAHGPYTVSGTFKGLRFSDNLGIIEIVDCRFEQKSPPEIALAAPPGSRELKVEITTVGSEDSLIRQHNATLTSVKCFATDDQIVIGFNVDESSWVPVKMIFPLLVRLFDKNGKYLTHFTTVEGFTAVTEVHRMRGEIYNRFMSGGLRDEAAKHKCELLRPRGNRLVHGVNVRDLRDAAMVEIGFAKGK